MHGHCGLSHDCDEGGGMILLLILAGILLSTAPSPAGRIVSHPPRSRTKTPRDGPWNLLAIAADIDLFAACLRAGQPIAAAVAAVSATHDTKDTAGGNTALSEAWSTVSALTSLGVEPERA